jgi:hypothetical protein
VGEAFLRDHGFDVGDGIEQRSRLATAVPEEQPDRPATSARSSGECARNASEVVEDDEADPVRGQADPRHSAGWHLVAPCVALVVAEVAAGRSSVLRRDALDVVDDGSAAQVQ